MISRKSDAWSKARWPALLCGLLALVWLAQEMKWLNATLPLGPLSLLAAALAMLSMQLER